MLPIYSTLIKASPFTISLSATTLTSSTKALASVLTMASASGFPWPSSSTSLTVKLCWVIEETLLRVTLLTFC